MGDVLILGNGISRAPKRRRIMEWEGEIWVCNWAFREPFPQITRVGTVHPEVGKAAAEYRKEKGLSYEIWGKPEVKMKYIDRCFELKRGWSTGNMLLAQAALEGCTEVTITGFDMGGKDLYQKNPLPGDQFRKQFSLVKSLWPEMLISKL